MLSRRDVGIQSIWRMYLLLVRMTSDNLRYSSPQLRLTISDQLPALSSLSLVRPALKKAKMAAVVDVVAAAAESSENPSHPTGSGRDICVS